jgi:ABC-type uncharacterized transport system involved in gliding motility auxiliary subunit
VIRPVVLLAAQVVSALVIVASLLALASRHFVRLDLTPERSLTLSAHTRQALARLEAPVTATAFTSAQSQGIRRDLEDLLALYRDQQPLVAPRVLDLDRSPGEAERLGVSDYNVVVLESRGRRQRVDLVNEETLTAAMLAVAGRPMLTAYLVQGHGEADAHDGDQRHGWGAAAAALERDGFDVRLLPGAARIPEDASLVVLAGPRRELQPAEQDALESWVRNGGRLVVLADPDSPRSLGALLDRFGVVLGGGVIVDEPSTLFGADGLAARVAQVNPEVVRERPVASALLPLAQRIGLEKRSGMHGQYLAVTDAAAWADAGGREPGAARVFRRGTDIVGPVPVGALVRVKAPGGREGRVVVLGDADFATNLHLDVLGNRDLLILAAEVAARDDDMLTASRRPPPPTGPFSTLALTTRQSRIILWAACIAPATALALGAVAAALRRRRNA